MNTTVAIGLRTSQQTDPHLQCNACRIYDCWL